MRRVQNVKVAPSVDDEDFGSIDAILNDVNTEMRDLLSEVDINTGGEAQKSTPRMSARGRGREAGPSSARMEVVHEDSDFDEEAIFSNGPVKKSGWDGGDDRSGSSEEESDDAEEIKFAHEVEDEGNVRELEKNMDKLVLQLDEFRKKYRSASEAMREKEDLKLKVEELEEELDEMQSAFEEEMADRDKSGGLLNVMGMSGVGGGSARNKTNGPGASIVDNSAMEAEIRSQLMHAEDNAEDDMSHMMATDAAKVSWQKRLEAVLELSLPFRKDIRQVEARFGTAVGAYLSFYRWIYMQFAVLFLAAAGFGIVHISYMVTARVPFGHIVSLDPLTFLLGFMKFQTFREEERLLYIALIITLNIVLFANGLMKLISEDQKRKRITAVSNDEELKYAKFILGAWDNNLGSKAEADDLQGSIGQNLVLLNSETRSKGAIMSRSGTEVFILFLRRFIANIVYVITVVASADIIITLQVRQKELDSVLPVDFITIPTIGVTAINSLTPTFLEIITEFEKWDSGDMELRFLTFRTYLSSTINLGILVMTVLMTADHTLMQGNAELNFFDFDLTNGIFLASRSYDVVRDNMGLVEQEVASTCERMEAAAGLAFGQVFSDSLTKAFFFWVTGVTPKIFSIMTGSEWVKEEVKIAELTVANIFSTGLVMVTLPFAPLSVLITPLVWYTNFKIEKWIIINYYTKPKKEIRGGKSGTIFAAFYLASVLVISLPCVYFFLMRNTFYAVDIVDDNGTYGELCTELKFATYGSRGPFVSGVDVNGVDVVYNEVFSSNAFLQVVWEVFVSRSYGVWFLLVLMYFAYRFTKNTLKVEREGQQSKEKIMQNLIASLRGNLSKKEQTIKKLKTIGRESDSDSDADAPAHDVQQDDGGAENGEGKEDEGDE